VSDAGVGSQHSQFGGILMDFGAANGALGQVLRREIPDIITCYLPGPDAAIHGEGTTASGFVWKWSDTAFWMVYKALQLRGYDTATMFVFVSDHGMSDVAQSGSGGSRANYDRCVVALEDKDGYDDDVGRVLQDDLGRFVWGYPAASNLNWPLATAACSPNGGMAHIYLRPYKQVEWNDQASLDATLAFNVAEQFVQKNHGGTFTGGSRLCCTGRAIRGVQRMGGQGGMTQHYE
jgi:hypothetical protein